MTDKTWQPTLLGHAIRMYAHDALREAGIGDEHHSRHLVDLMRATINEHGKDRAIEMVKAVWRPVRLDDNGLTPIVRKASPAEHGKALVVADEPVKEPSLTHRRARTVSV